MKLKNVIFLCAIAVLTACSSQSKKCDEKSYTAADIKRLGITNEDYLSSASKRALAWGNKSNDWYIEYRMYDLKGDFAYEEGVVRRDPSAIIKEDGLYYTWYSRSVGPCDGFASDIETSKVFPWDRCDIWYATSKDGMTWKEEGPAVTRGPKGSYDDRSVFTVEIMQWEDKYYLAYQTVKSPYSGTVKNQVGLAWADSPRGPWTKSKEPILSPSESGAWGGDGSDRFNVKEKGCFDSHKVHDPCILPFKGKFYLYYKGERIGEQITWGGREICHGVAIADDPKGPYVKSPYNPISNSGHEICVWPYQGGIASLITTDGPERNTMQWSPDGINFEIMGAIKGAPHAIGLNRTVDTEKEPTEILRWGLTHQYRSHDYQYIRGFRTHRLSVNKTKGE